MPEPFSKKDRRDKVDELGSHIRDILQEELKEQENTPHESTMSGLSAAEQPWAEKDILWRFRHVSLSRVSAFTREMAVLLSVGMPIMQALRNVAARTQNSRLRETLYRMGVMIENGSTFWEALDAFPQFFPPLYVSTVRSGEVSGQLDAVLNRLAAYTEREVMLRRKVVAALIYPIVIVAVAIAVCIILSIFVMPVFQRMLEEFGTEPPLLTRAVTGTALWLNNNWLLVIIIPIVLYVVYKLAIQAYPVRLLADRIKIHTPLVGGLVKKMLGVRFARTFALLFHSGVPIIESLKIAERSLGNEVAALEVNEMRTNIENGATLESSIQMLNQFPPLLIDMLVVGEQAGRLDEVLTRVADIYDEEVDIAVTNIGRTIEPAIILIMGVLVAAIFAAFFLPYIEMLSAAGSL